MANYYNDNNPEACAWTQLLIDEKLIPYGYVDNRSITEVEPSDLEGFTQCHFFCGIGGWPLALRIAGIPDTLRIDTGSAPCQPFSIAGKGLGEADERHLWPQFARLIAKRGATAVFGEQVASKDGRDWLARVRLDLEAMGYAVGASDLCAAGAGAPHIRQRLFWGGVDVRVFERRRLANVSCQQTDSADASRLFAELGRRSLTGEWVEHSPSDGRIERRAQSKGRGTTSGCGDGSGMGESSSPGRDQRQPTAPGVGQRRPVESAGSDGGVGNSNYRRKSPVGGVSEGAGVECPGGPDDGLGNSNDEGSQRRVLRRNGSGERIVGQAGLGYWGNFDLVPCRDEKVRRIESGTFPLAHGLPGRVGLLRGYGNAIVPQVAAKFLQAFFEVI